MKIGLTGGIGVGKSSVLKLFKTFGTTVISTDAISRNLVQVHKPTFSTIVTHFGKFICKKDGKLDRAKLRGIIFTNTKEREWLESLLHPVIYKEIEYQYENITTPYVIIEIPLFLESKLTISVDRILMIDCSANIQIARVTTRDKVGFKQVASIIASQLPREAYLAICNDILHNNGTLDELKAKSLKLHHIYSKLVKN